MSDGVIQMVKCRTSPIQGRHDAGKQGNVRSIVVGRSDQQFIEYRCASAEVFRGEIQLGDKIVRLDDRHMVTVPL
jgi:hypothetical protein